MALKWLSFDHGRLLELVPQSSFRMKSPSKQNLKLCNPSKHNVLNTTRSTVSETMSILDNISLDGQVVVTSKFSGAILHGAGITP